MEEIKEEINLIDLWRIIWKNRIFIIGFTFFIVVLTMIVSLLVPKSYKAKGVILPSLTSEVTSFSTLVSSLGFSVKQQISNIDLCYSILKSRTILDKIIEKFNLMEIYKAKTKEDARKRLSNLTEIKKNKEGTIEINVIDFSPVRARDIVNSYITLLDETIRCLNITSASQKKLFIEKRLKETEAELKSIEEKVKNYQVEKKISVGRDELTAAKTAGEIQGRYLAKKIELETLKKFSTSNNPEVIKLENEVKELEKTIVNLPPLETEMQRLLRDLKIQETLFTYLTSEYETAKIEEARDTPVISVVDWAEIPEKKYKPKIRINMAISGIISLFLSIFIVFIKERISELKNNIQNEQQN
ncbi:MAG: GumC family protein [Candidatus Ratteibacteria bacterium]